MLTTGGPVIPATAPHYSRPPGSGGASGEAVHQQRPRPQQHQEAHHVGEGGQPDGGGQGGVYLQGLQPQGDEGAHHARHYHVAHHGAEDHRRQPGVLVETEGQGSGQGARQHPVQQAESDLLGDDAQGVARGGVAQGQGAHHHRGRLGARVAAVAGDDGHEHGQGGRLGHGALEGAHRQGRHEGGEQVHHQVGNPPLQRLAQGAEGPLLHPHAGQAVEVFGGLLGDHVQHVVGGDDAQQHPLLVHHRQRPQPVALDEAGHLLLVRLRRHRDDVPGHELGDGGAGGGDDELAQVDHPLQAVGAVQHVEVVALLGEGLMQAQVGDGLLDGHVRVQGHVAAGHQPAGGVLGVLQDGGHVGSGAHVGQHPGGVGRGQVADDVGRLVRVHVVQHPRQGLAGHAGHQRLHLLFGQVLQQAGQPLGVEEGQEGLPLRRRQAAEELGLVGGVDGAQQGRDLLHAGGVAGQHLLHLADDDLDFLLRRHGFLGPPLSI